MFTTWDHAKAFSMSIGEGENSWEYVEVGLNMPWFIVDFTQRADGEGLRSTFMFKNVEQILQLKKVTQATINAVQLITTSNMNKSDSWGMERVSKIYKGFVRGDEMKYPIFKYLFSNGFELIDTRYRKVASEEIDFELIFEM